MSFNNFFSSLKAIDIGVPQGFILGPLLFLVYVNNIAYATLSKPHLFADDTCLVLLNISITNLESNCNGELTKLLNWCNANKLQINPLKSTAVIPSKLNAANTSVNLVYDDKTTACAKSCK